MRPLRLFWIAYLGGLGHTFMDFTNNYGVRPLLPFSSRWFYGDIIFVVDPWIWLILGSSVVWLTTTNSARALFWLVVGIIPILILAGIIEGFLSPSGLSIRWKFSFAASLFCPMLCTRPRSSDIRMPESASKSAGT